jgi:Ca2+-binding RTX toxin-like protein
VRRTRAKRTPALAKALIVGLAVAAAAALPASAAVTEIPLGGTTGDYFEGTCGFGIGGKALQGDTANDRIAGSPESDLLRGGGGDDRVDGLEDDDCIFGQRGDDRLKGRVGDDRIRAGRGRDKVHGNDGDDDIRLQDGGDRVHAGNGDDHIKSQGRRARGHGVDRVNCGPGQDTAVVDRWDRVKRNCERVRVVQP